VRLLDEVPAKWRPLCELLAATGLRISEAVGLRGSDLVLDGDTPHLQVRRAAVKGALVAPKSRHGARLIPLTAELGTMLRARRPRRAENDASRPPQGAAICPAKGNAGQRPGQVILRPVTVGRSGGHDTSPVLGQ
jgi:integrase